MALPTTGPLSLYQIYAEFGGPVPIDLRNYYRGGAYVPNIPANYNIPTSGAIDIRNFYGATKYEPLQGATSPIWGVLFLLEPAPASASVSAYGTAGATGGTGSYTYVWTVLTGSASISGGNTGAGVTLVALVHKNIPVSGTVRCQISDGVSTIQITRNYEMSYTTNI